MIGAASGDREAAIQQICTQPPEHSRHDPYSARADYYRVKLARYRKLYQLTRSLHQDD
jgi:xylulokinase